MCFRKKRFNQIWKDRCKKNIRFAWVAVICWALKEEATFTSKCKMLMEPTRVIQSVAYYTGRNEYKFITRLYVLPRKAPGLSSKIVDKPSISFFFFFLKNNILIVKGSKLDNRRYKLDFRSMFVTEANVLTSVIPEQRHGRLGHVDFLQIRYRRFKDG